MQFRNSIQQFYPALLTGLAAQILFFLLALNYQALYLTDSAEYFYQAANLKIHGSFYCWEWKKPFSYEMWTRRTPVYGYLIFLIQKISDSHFVILLFQHMLAYINFAGLLFILKDSKLPKRILNGIIMAAIILFPTRLVYTNMVMSEVVFETELFWAFAALVLYCRKPKVGYLLAYNSLLVLAVLTKPVMVYFWLPNLLFMLFLGWKEKTIKPVVYSCLMPLVIVGLSFNNKQLTGYFHFSSIKTYNLYDYNTKILLTYLHGPEAAEKAIGAMVKPDNAYPGLKEKWAFLEATCYRIIKDNLALYTFLHARGMVNFFLDPGRYDLYYFLPPLQSKTEISFFNSYRENGVAGLIEYFSNLPLALTVYMALIILWNVITLAGLACFVLFQKFMLENRIFIALLVGYICAASGIIGCARFKEPVYFLLIFATVLTAEQFWNKKKN